MYRMNIELPAIIIISGKPKQGKSHLINYFMYTQRKMFDYGIVFTKTKFNDGFEYIPDRFVHPNYYEDKLENMMKLQAKLIEEGIKKKCFVIFDDCLTSEFKNDLFQDLITQYRHYNMTIIISTQYIYKLNPTIRECANYVVIFRQSTKRSLDALYDSFGSHFDKYDDFKNYVINNTGNFQFILVDINSQSDDISKIYRVMKAPEKIPYFKLKYNTEKKSH